jgi:secondary thiamine-phosphate synthase enzyme
VCRAEKEQQIGASNRLFRVLQEPEPGSDARVRRAGGLIFWAESLPVLTTAARQFVDITEAVAGVVQRANVQQGWVSVFSKHTTAAVVIQENEPLLLEDMTGLLERLSPSGHVYGHNDMERRVGEKEPDECANGHAHCQHLLLGSSENIPILSGRMELGRWQRVFLLELDRGRERHVLVQVFGA